MTGVPPIQHAPSAPQNDIQRQAELEFEMLQASANARSLANRDSVQRYALRWIAVITGLSCILFMALIVSHLVHYLFIGPFLTVPSSFAIVAIVAPLASITTVTIVIFVAAFRQFKSSDEADAGGKIIEALRSANLIN